MGNLEFAEGILEKWDVWGFGEEEGENRCASAAGHRLAPAELGDADRPGFGLRRVSWVWGERRHLCRMLV